MDSFAVPLYASLFQIMGQIMFFVFWKFREVFPSWLHVLELKSPTYTQWNFDWPLFLLRNARMYFWRCLRSNMIGMFCTTSWGPFSNTWIIRFDSALNVCKVLFCHRSCWRTNQSGWFSIFLSNTRTFQLALQQNVVIVEFGSPCSPRSTLLARDLFRHNSTVAGIKWTWVLLGSTTVAPFSMTTSRKERASIIWERDVFFHLARFSCQFQKRVSGSISS